MATPKRTGGAKPEVVGGDTAAGRRAARKAAGPGATDQTRDQAYRQGQAAAKRALDERPRGRRAKGPAQVHADPELQEYYEQGHNDHVSDARRDALRERVAAPAASARSAGDNGAGFVLGLIGFALLRNYLTGGWSGVNAWFAAKFLNRTTAASSVVPPGTYKYKNAPGTDAGRAAGAAIGQIARKP